MRLVGRQILADFMKEHADCRGAVLAWVREVETREWKTTQEVKDRYASASFLAENHVVFNIKGNTYRLKVAVDYSNSIVRILKIDTHAGYDRW